MRKRSIISMMIILACLTACAERVHYAPVKDVATIEHIPKSGTYRVLPGETLYSIAWRYGLDYRYLAQRNHVLPPYHVLAGQRIYLRGQPSQPAVASHSIITPSLPVIEREPATSVAHWRWPASGPIIGTYSGLNKGINIGGHPGASVYATAAGKVVYCGNGLRGYGNLIIIKHNSLFLTAYANNSAVWVKEGDWVKAGQKIATMGRGPGARSMLHFEIRHTGNPVNPLKYLSAVPRGRVNA